MYCVLLISQIFGEGVAIELSNLFHYNSIKDIENIPVYFENGFRFIACLWGFGNGGTTWSLRMLIGPSTRRGADLP